MCFQEKDNINLLFYELRENNKRHLVGWVII